MPLALIVLEKQRLRMEQILEEKAEQIENMEEYCKYCDECDNER